jgi:hypothetical protein
MMVRARIPAQVWMAARVRRAVLIPWWLFIQRKSSGATRPARFPTELIQAIPAAAAVPERMAVGTLQKQEVVARTPVRAMDRVTRIIHPGRPGRALRAKPRAAVRAERPTWRRRSLLRSEWRQTQTMPKAAQAHGMAE